MMTALTNQRPGVRAKRIAWIIQAWTHRGRDHSRWGVVAVKGVYVCSERRRKGDAVCPSTMTFNVEAIDHVFLDGLEDVVLSPRFIDRVLDATFMHDPNAERALLQAEHARLTASAAANMLLFVHPRPRVRLGRLRFQRLAEQASGRRQEHGAGCSGVRHASGHTHFAEQRAAPVGFPGLRSAGTAPCDVAHVPAYLFVVVARQRGAR